MWEAISTVLTSPNAWEVLIFLFVAILIVLLLIRNGRLLIKTKHFRIGQAEREHEVIRRQVEAAHYFVLSIEGKIRINEKCEKYFTKYILERVYDKVIEWIMFNHINTSPMYIEDKQDTICNLVYTFQISDEYKTPEFKQRMQKWTVELIEKLVHIREIYQKGD